MARVNHKRVKQLLNEKRSRITDRQFFTSRILAGHFEDMAMAQTRRYKYNRRIHVAISWSPKSGEVACTNNLSVLINAGHRLVTQNRGRENRYEIVCGLFAHELGHCLYTDFLAGQTYNNYLSREKWYPEPPAYKLPKDTVNERALWEYVRLESRNNEMLRYVAHHISNVIEDAYIENRILAQFRGTLGNCLEALREQQYESIPTVTELIEKEDDGNCHTGIAREEVHDALIARLDVQGSIPKPEHIPMPVVAEVPPTDIASRSDTYTGLLSKLTLASDHRQNLRNRGLSDEEIDRLEYRTTPVVGMQTIARQLQSSGYYLSGVPGFYRKDGKWSFACESRGILIPVRDSKGRIQGMQIRRDNAARRKFRWVSSTGRTDGCKAEGWVHIAGKPRNMVLLTEGPMKADVIHYLTGQTVLAVAGVNSLTQLELILPQLHEQGVERIMTAFDMDFMENPHVQGGYRTLVSLLSDAGFRYGTYLWDPRYKGLDDYVWEHCFQRQLS